MKHAFILLFLLIAAWPSRADQVINYTGGAPDNFNSYDTSGANDPTRLSISFGTATQSGSLYGSGSVQKEGLGTVILSGSNSYSGVTTVSAGTLQIGNGFGGSLAGFNTVTVASGATLAINTSSFQSFSNSVSNSGTVTGVQSFGNSSTISGAISGSGGFTQTGLGKTILTGSNTYTGATSVSAGTLQIGDNFSSGSISNSSTVSVGSGATLALSLGFFGNFSNAVSNGGTVASIGSSSGTIGGAISGGGGFTQNGSGTTILTGSNTYTGATSVAAGTLIIGDGFSGGSISGSSAVSVASGATLAINLNSLTPFSNNIANSGTVAGGVQFSSALSTIGGVISGAGGFKQAGSGTTILTGSNTYTGATSVAAGTLIIGNGSSGAISNLSAVTVGAGATLSINLASLQTFSNNIDNSGMVTTSPTGSVSDVVISGVISGSGGFKQTSIGKTTLRGSNTYTGATSVSAGTLQIGDGISSGSISGSSAVTVGAGATLALALNFGSFSSAVSNSGTMTSIGPLATISGAIGGGGTFIQNGIGTTILTGSNTYTGATSVAAGTLQIGDGFSGGSISNLSAVTVGSGATLALALSSFGSFSNAISNSGTVSSIGSSSGASIDGVISGGGGFTQAGLGVTILRGSNTYTGATSVAAGTLVIGSGFIGGTISGSSAVTVASGATLAINLNSLTPFSNNIANSGTVAGGVQSGSSLSTISGVISGSGGFNQAGFGTTILTGSNTYTGATSVAAGTLVLGDGTSGSISTGSAVSVAPGATLTLSLASSATFSNDIASEGTVGSTGDSTTLTGVISGGGQVVLNPVSSSSLMRLSGNNTYTGGTVLTSGILAIGSNGALSTGTITINGGNIRASGAARTLSNPITINGSFTLGRSTTFSGPVTLAQDVTLTSGNPDSSAASTSTISGVISGSKGITFTEGLNPIGSIVLSGANTHTGATGLLAGTLVLGNSLALQNSTFDSQGGTLQFSGITAATFGGLKGSQGIVLRNAALAAVALTVGGNGADTAYSGVLSGSGSLTKAGSGTLNLSGTNTYTGGTTLSAGILEIGANGAIPAGTLTINGGNLRASGGPRTLSNPVTVNGSFTLGRSTNLSGAITLAQNATITSANPDAGATATSTLSGVIGGSYGLTFAAGANPTGKIVLSGANTYTGGTTISGGTVVAAHNGEIGTFQAGTTVTVNSGGTLQANLSDSLGWGNGNAKLVVNGGTVTTDGVADQHTSLQDVTMTAGRLTDTGGNGHYFLNGPLVTNASATSAVIDASIFEIGAGWVLGTTSLTVANGAAPVDLLISSGLTGTNPLDKKGAGLLRLTGTSAFSGVTTVSAGTLVVDGSLASSPMTTIQSGATLGGAGTVGPVTVSGGGTISPGNSPGTLNTGSETWNPLGGYTWEINKANGTHGADPGWDWLNISGSLTIASTTGNRFTINVTSLTLANAAGIAPNFVRGQTYSFPIATASGGISGFSADRFLVVTSGFFNDPTNLGGFAIIQSGDSLMLTYTAIPEPPTYAIGIATLLGGLILLRRRRAAARK